MMLTRSYRLLALDIMPQGAIGSQIALQLTVREEEKTLGLVAARYMRESELIVERDSLATHTE